LGPLDRIVRGRFDVLDLSIRINRYRESDFPSKMSLPCERWILRCFDVLWAKPFLNLAEARCRHAEQQESEH